MISNENWNEALVAAEALMAADLDAAMEGMHPLVWVERSYAEDGRVCTVAYREQPHRRICSTCLVPRSISYEGDCATAELDYRIDWEGGEGVLPEHFHIVETLRMEGHRWVLLERISEAVSD